VKTSTSRKASVKRLGISLSRFVEQRGGVIISESDTVDYNLTDYKLPADGVTGSTLKPEPVVPRPEVHNKSNGSTVLTVIQKYEVETVLESVNEDENVLQNSFFSSFSLSNNENKMIVVKSISSEYCNSAGKWVAAKTYVGRRIGSYNYDWKLDRLSSDPEGAHITLSELAQYDVAVRTDLPAKGRVFSTLYRAHQSFPQPLKLKITFELNNGEQAIIFEEQVNEPLPLATKESRIAEYAHSQKVLHWASCDDTEKLYRLFVAVHTSNDDPNQLFVYIPIISSWSIDVRPEMFAEIAYLATKAKKAEWEMNEKWKYDAQGFSVTSTALVDVSKQVMYAIRFVLKTTTSSVTTCFAIPKLVLTN